MGAAAGSGFGGVCCVFSAEGMFQITGSIVRTGIDSIQLPLGTAARRVHVELVLV